MARARATSRSSTPNRARGGTRPPGPPDWGRTLHRRAETVGHAVQNLVERAASSAASWSRRTLWDAAPGVHVRRVFAAGVAVLRRAARGNRRAWVRLGVWTIGLAGALSITLYALSRREPAWFRTLDPATLALRADQIENRVVSEAYRFRGSVRAAATVEGVDASLQTGEEWSFTLTEEDATAWLGGKLPRWLSNLHDRLIVPPGVRDLQARFADGRVILGARASLEGADRVLTYSFRPVVESGGLWLRSPRVGLGSLRLPAWMLLTRTERRLGLRDSLGDVVPLSELEHALQGDAALLSQALVRLEDGRSVRILAIEPGEGVVTLRCRTEVTRE